jgi:ATP-dependent Lon protease
MVDWHALRQDDSVPCPNDPERPVSDPKDAEILPDDHPIDQAKPVEPEPAPPQVVTRPESLLPTVVVALPLSQRPAFPHMLLPLVIPAGRLADAARHAVEHRGGYVAFFLTKGELGESAAFTPEDLQPVGCIARITKHADGEGGALQVFAQALARFRFDRIDARDPLVLVHGEVMRPQVDANDAQVRSCAMAIVTSLKELVQHNPVFADEIRMVLANFNNLDGPSRLADMAASLTTAKREELQQVLEVVPVVERMEKVLTLLAKETQLAQLKSKIQGQIEQKVSEHQRKFFLNEQLKAIKQELGLETDDKTLELNRLREQVAAKGQAISEEARGVIDEELRKLAQLDPNSSEYGVTRSRLEWLVGLPWGVVTEDQLDLARLREGLDADHFGLEDVKDRIVEFVAVRKLRPERRGGIICLVGPPGTGKTSVGASIAKQLGRKFYRFSLGGMRDEAEIKGHRRTYVGALPGKPAQALKRCGSMNPVILLDEVDKLAHGMQGDPAAALLEVLDPEQNRDFLDHYLDVRVDLSQVLFICTANDLGGIPEPLRDRMEIIRLAGYVEQEKIAIARDHLVPKAREAHGLAARDLAFSPTALRSLIRDHAREAGVRHLDQLIAKVCRKIALAKAGGTAGTRARALGPGDLAAFLGKPLMRDDELLAHPRAGVVTGLAWTSLGGATLEIEAVATTAEKGGLTLTGQLGDVMKESASLARSYLMSWLASESARLGVAADWFDRHLVHLHVPAGATPKDGPSAGITIACTLLSLASGRAVRPRLGMTGELTLTGRVYPIGGVREKLVAAKRAGLALVLLPEANRRDYDELPELVRSGIKVEFVATLAEVLAHAGLVPAAKTAKAGRKRR